MTELEFLRMRIKRAVSPPLDALAPDWIARHCQERGVDPFCDIAVLGKRLAAARAIPILRPNAVVPIRSDLATRYELAGIATLAMSPQEVNENRRRAGQRAIDEARRRMNLGGREHVEDAE